MKKKIEFRGARVVYNDTGNGDVLFFLHGYLENREIWDSFIVLFPEDVRIITLDIPGHGESGIWGDEHSIDDLAALVTSILDKEEINKVYLIGHSMGGYITMAFAELYRERLNGFALFHSTCFADSDEKKINREREISLVKCGKKNQIINVNIPKSFAGDNLEFMKDKVEKSKIIARSCNDDGMIALLRGMMSRPGRDHILAKPDIPILLIGGEKDNYIPVEIFDQMKTIAPHSTTILLKNSGHMGFIEEPENALRTILSWIGKI